MAISKEISRITRPFVKEYIETLAKAKDEDKIVTGEDFEKMFRDWLKENGNKTKYKNLCAEIKRDVAKFKKTLNPSK